MSAVIENKRYKTPIILQMEATECGAVALAIILAFYKKYVPLAEVRQACGISRDGSRAINMLKAARRYDMDAHAIQVDYWESTFSLMLPCIVFWAFDHFVVLEGYKDHKIYINDPAIGPRIISEKEFDESFTGIVLEIKPKIDFKKSGKPISTLSILKNKMQGFSRALYYIILISLMLVIPGILIPIFSKIFIDDILVKHTPNWFVPLILGMIITAVVRGICTWLQKTTLLRLNIQLFITSTTHFLWHILRLPLDFFNQRYMGDIAERIYSNERIARLMSSDISGSIVNLITMVFFAMMMLFMSWPIALVGILAAFINGIALYIISYHIGHMSYRLEQDIGKLKSIEINGLQAIDTLKANSAESMFFNRWSSQHVRMMNGQQKIATYGSVLEWVPKLMDSLTTVCLLGIGSYLIIHGYLTLGGLVAMQSLMLSFSAPLSHLLTLGTEIAAIRGDLLRIDDVLSYDEEKKLSIKSDDISLTNELLYENVTFGYSRLEEPVIKNISFHLKHGVSLAIVGKTGSGKSTIAKLAVALYKPWSGSVHYARHNIHSLSSSAIANLFSLVDNEDILFTGTVAENISLFNDHISEEDMLHAMKTSCIYETVMQRGGLSTVVEERGLNFSGGQRQRLEIARGLVTHPKLMILDEAMSALDPALECEIIKKIKDQVHTLLVITHRISAIKDFDHILVIDKGSIVQEGRHDQLIEQEGIYQSLCKAGE